MKFWNRAGGQLSELVTADAAVVFYQIEIVALLDVGGQVAFPAELARVRNLQHRIPVDGGIIFRCVCLARCRDGAQVELLSRLAVHLRRVDEAIAAYPDLVLGLRKVGNDVTPLIVGHDHLGIPGRQICRFRNDPRAGFGPVCSRDHAADVVIVDRNRRCLRI